MGRDRFKWDVIESDYSAGEASALAASQKMASGMFSELASVGANAFNKRGATALENANSKSASNTASIIEQIRAGKTPERTGFYDAAAIGDAKYEYDKYQTAQAFKRRAEGRSIAAAGRARKGTGTGGGSGGGGGTPGGYVPYGSGASPAEASVLDAYLPIDKSAPFDNNMMGSLYEEGGMFQPDAGAYSAAPDMTVLDEMIANKDYPSQFEPTIDSVALWQAANPNPETSRYNKAAEMGGAEQYLDANKGMSLPVRDRAGRLAIDPNAENARWNMIDKDMNSEWPNEWKAKDARAGYYTDQKNDNNIVNGPYGSGSGDFSEYPSAPIDRIDVAKQKLVQAMNSKAAVTANANAENAAIQADILSKKVDEQRALAKEARIKAGERAATPDYPKTSKVTSDSLIPDNSNRPGSDINRKMKENERKQAEQEDILSKKIKKKEEADSLKAFQDARDEDAKALKVQDAAIDKRVADEKAEVVAAKTAKKTAEIDRLKTLTPEEAGKEVFANWKKGDMKDKDAATAIKKYYESKGVTVTDEFIAKTAKHVTGSVSEPAAKKTPAKTPVKAPVKKAGSVMTGSQLKGRHAKESIKYTKTRNDIVSKAKKEKLAITKWAKKQTNNVSLGLPTTTQGGRDFKANEGRIKRDAERLTAVQDLKIAEAETAFKGSKVENDNALGVGEASIEEAKVAREKKEQPAKDALKAANKLKNELRSADTKEKKKFADFKAVQKKLNPSVSENMVLARYNGLNLDGSKYQAPKKETKTDRAAKRGKVKTDAVLSSIQKLTGVKASKLDAARGSSGSYQKLNDLKNHVNNLYPTAQTSDVVAFLRGGAEDKVLDESDNWFPWQDASSAINYKSERLIELFDKYAKTINLKEGEDGYVSSSEKKIVDKNADAVRALKPNN